MSETWRSVLTGLGGLYVLLFAALLLALFRGRGPFPTPPTKTVNLFLAGIACQCLHVAEEFISGFHVRFPTYLGLAPWPDAFFVTFNLVWIAIWLLAAIGIQHRLRIAWFPIWFFALGMAANGLVHPLLAVSAGGYFPGLWTSLLVGPIGFLLLFRLWVVTGPVTHNENPES